MSIFHLLNRGCVYPVDQRRPCVFGRDPVVWYFEMNIYHEATSQSLTLVQELLFWLSGLVRFSLVWWRGQEGACSHALHYNRMSMP